MNMIQKTYPCVIPVFMPEGFNNTAREYDISAWMAEGSDTVNLRYRDPWGWGSEVMVEKLSWYKSFGVENMDDLVEHLYWVVKV